jgi:hypothetical protein
MREYLSNRRGPGRPPTFLSHFIREDLDGRKRIAAQEERYRQPRLRRLAILNAGKKLLHEVRTIASPLHARRSRRTATFNLVTLCLKFEEEPPREFVEEL